MPIINWGWSQVVARSEELQVSHVVSETKITWDIICCLPWRLVIESWIECRDRRKIQGIWLGCRHPSWWLNSLFHSTQLWNIKFCWDFKNIKRTVVKMLLRGWCHVPPPVGHFTWAPFGAPAAPFMIQLSACGRWFNSLGLYTCLGDAEEASGPWLLISLALVVAAICVMNIQDLFSISASLSVSLFLNLKSFLFFF